MKVMITSFGVEHSLTSEAGHDSVFHRMPPVSFRQTSETFMPDYELLLLCDTVVMDEASYHRLTRDSIRAYSQVSETFQALKAEGRIELNDFSSTLRPHIELLDRMIDRDLKQLDQWVGPLRESLALWRHFASISMDLVETESERLFQRGFSRDKLTHLNVRNPDDVKYAIMRELVHLTHGHRPYVEHVSQLVTEALESSEKRKHREYRQALRDLVRAYLMYVDANLILSHQLEIGFHDWLDFTPFYAAKFLSVGRDQDPIQDSKDQLEKLFTISFPDLAIRDTRALMKVLNDKRLEDLRRLVDEAVEGRIQFDDQFAKSILGDVVRSSERARKRRSVVGYATLPFDLIPWVGGVAQKAIEEAVSVPFEKKLRQKHRWFYMLSDVAGTTG
jgi:hypothetical protein